MAKRAIPIPESDEESDEEEVFEVSKILDHKHASKAGLQYLIRWKGYEDPSEDTWEPESNVNETASAKVKAYWRTVSADRRGDQKLSKLAASPSAAMAKKRRPSEQSARGRGKVQVHDSDSDLDSEEDEGSRPPPKKAKATAPTSNRKRAPNSTASSSARKKPSAPIESQIEDEKEEEEEEEKENEKDDKSRNGTKPSSATAKTDDKKESAADERDAGSNGDDTLDGYEAEGDETDYHLTRYADRQTFDDLVDHIETIVAGDEEDGHRMMAVWKIDGTHSYLPEAIWRRMCPQAALDFFVKHLKFKSTNAGNNP
ncbi:BQ2448_1679 [Microbotryum intermedium]|uniref:BQ2448_1679 protein n=1 Tax=Microbotryum intermedium TaxID=269621 RepID=A0A238FAQ0_9BASI|nr:BQ2448_1679 [Microbotryum intermedium]